MAGDGHQISALLPKQELQQSLGVALVERNVGAFVRQDRGPIDGDGTITAFESDREILAALGSLNHGAVSAVPENSGKKIGIQNWMNFW